MKKWAILLAVFLSASLLYANDALDRQFREDYLSENPKSEKMASRPGHHNSRQEALQDWATRKVCPREHPGVFFDTTYEDPGVWCCQGIARDGKKCPYHIDLQYPKGIPKQEA